MAGLVGLVFLGAGLLLMGKGQVPSHTLAVPTPTPVMATPLRPPLSTPAKARISVPVRRVPASMALEEDEYEAPTELISAAGLREILDQMSHS
jgi:hypothetical protein